MPIVTGSVGVHGPVGVGASCARRELVATVTWSGLVAVSGAPMLVWSCTDTGADVTPAVSVCAGVVNASSDGRQEASSFQESLNQAPPIPAVHQRFWPAGPQAPTPGSFGSTVCPESRIAAASRSMTTPVWLVKSDVESPTFFGAQAKPPRSSGP